MIHLKKAPNFAKTWITIKELDLTNHITIEDGAIIIDSLDIGEDYYFSLERMYSIFSEYSDNIDNLQDLIDSILPPPLEE